MVFTYDTVLARYLAKIERQGLLPDEQRQAFLALPFREQTFEARRTISQHNSGMHYCVFIGAGLTSRIKDQENGSRQIVALDIPGDSPGMQGILFDAADDSIYTHTLTNIVLVSRADIRALARQHHALAEALWMDTLIAASISREWTVNLGQRKAEVRIAHLLLEMEARFIAMGQDMTGYVLPLNQSDLGYALGLSLVHLNKSLQKLRSRGLIELHYGRVTIADSRAMQKFTQFDDTYLHLGHSEARSMDQKLQLQHA